MTIFLGSGCILGHRERLPTRNSSQKYCVDFKVFGVFSGANFSNLEKATCWSGKTLRRGCSGPRAVPVFCLRGMFGLLGAISFKGKSSFYEEVCPRPWTCRGKDAKSRGTDILGRGKGIKRSARDYVGSDSVPWRHQPSPKRLWTENRLSQKTIIIQNSLWSPKAFEKTTALIDSVFLFFAGETIGKKVGDVQAFVAAASSLLWTKDRCFAWNKVPSNRSLYSFNVFT